jgi:hypothetical protein
MFDRHVRCVRFIHPTGSFAMTDQQQFRPPTQKAKTWIVGIIAAVFVALPITASAPAASAAVTSTSVAAAHSARTETVAQRQARLMAADYLDGQEFSRNGLIAQLKYEGFSTRVATYGVDHVRVSWYRQAVKMARGYLEYQHFSRSGLIAQLRYEGFTRAQAVYGVNRTGL